MSRTRIPDEVLSAAHDRSAARAARDWAEADRLRAEIEAAGWKVVDRGTDFALTPVAPPDVVDGGHIRYGASANVPSRLDEPATGPATVVLVASEGPAVVAETLAALRSSVPAGTSVVIVAEAPSDADAAAFDALEDEATDVVWMHDRLGVAAARNAGLRRALGEIVVILDPAVVPTGDVVSPLVAVLADPGVAIAAGHGLRTADLRVFAEADGDVDLVDGAVQAFRRADYRARGPLDERFRVVRSLDAWWSLVLRDEGEGSAPRRAVALDGFPGRDVGSDDDGSIGSAGSGVVSDRDRKRDFYRLRDQFGWREDLLTSEG